MDVGLHATAKPDAADVDRALLETRPSTGPLSDAADAFDVVIPLAAWQDMQRHARVRLDAEVGGVLIGKPVATPEGKPYLLIEAGIPALAAESRETNITFTAEAWTHIHEIIDRDHPGAIIVGWYHTHPSFGIFLSEMDLFIQHHFFDLPHHVAIVIDPVANTHGCFIWRAGTPTLGPLTIEGPTSQPAPLPPTPHAPEETPREEDEGVPRPRRTFSPLRSTRAHLDAIIDPLARLDAAQWVALLTLLALTAVLFGALVLIWFDVSPQPMPGLPATRASTKSA